MLIIFNLDSALRIMVDPKSNNTEVIGESKNLKDCIGSSLSPAQI